MSTTKKLCAALALTLVSAAVTARTEQVSALLHLAVDVAVRTVAVGPFMDYNG